MWQAVRKVTDTEEPVKLKGCLFHWTQAVYLKVQELGLVPAYKKKASTYQLIKMLFDLPLLPANQIQPAFNLLRETTTTDRLQQLMSYIDKTWMTSTVWTIDTWSMYREPVRTNNKVKGWHHRINSKASRTNLQLYLLVPLLHHEAEYAEHQVHLLNNNNLRRYQRKKYRQLQGQIFELWENYDETNMTTSQFLRKAGSLYQPTLQ